LHSLQRFSSSTRIGYFLPRPSNDFSDRDEVKSSDRSESENEKNVGDGVKAVSDPPEVNQSKEDVLERAEDADHWNERRKAETVRRIPFR